MFQLPIKEKEIETTVEKNLLVPNPNRQKPHPIKLDRNKYKKSNKIIPITKINLDPFQIKITSKSKIKNSSILKDQIHSLIDNKILKLYVLMKNFHQNQHHRLQVKT